MPDHAGFAAAITLRERVLNDALLFAYSSPSFSRDQTIPFLGTGPAVLLRAFLSPPTVTCDATREALVVGVDLPGALTINEPTGVETHFVLAHVDVAIPPVFTLKNRQLTLSPAHPDVKVVAWSYTVVGGGAFKPATDAYLRSSVMAERLSATVQLALDSNLLTLPSVDVSSLGAIVDAAAPPPDTTASVPVRVVNGALVAGLNVEGFMPPWQPPGHTGGITLHGQTFALDDFAVDYDLAVVTNPDALPILLADVEDKIVSAVGAGNTIESLTLTAGAGAFGVAGRASNSDGHATFSFSIVPHMDAVRPGGAINYIEKPFVIHPRSYAGLWFSTEDPNIDASVDLSFWETALAGLLTVLTVGGMLEYIHEMVESVEYGFRISVAGGTSGTPTALVHRVSSPALADVTLRIAVEEYSITSDGPFMGVTIKPEPKQAALIGPQSIPANLLVQQLTYSVRLPLGVVADDPSLHVQWTVIDPTTGTLQLNQDGPAKGRTTLAVTPKQFGAELGKCAVGCRVYRTAGAQTTEIFNDVVHLAVTPVPAGPAYVAWDYDVQRHGVHFDAATNTWTYEGEPVAHRHSKIHRVNGGCTNAGNRSRYLYRVTDMFVLPFPVADIDAHRVQLCDYCFYGGPAGLRATL
jgi:hypothetical protein